MELGSGQCRHNGSLYCEARSVHVKLVTKVKSGCTGYDHFAARFISDTQQPISARHSSAAAEKATRIANRPQLEYPAAIKTRLARQ